jgi:hypothetical protein
VWTDPHKVSRNNDLAARHVVVGGATDEVADEQADAKEVDDSLGQPVVQVAARHAPEPHPAVDNEELDVAMPRQVAPGVHALLSLDNQWHRVGGFHEVVRAGDHRDTHGEALADLLNVVKMDEQRLNAGNIADR